MSLAFESRACVAVALGLALAGCIVARPFRGPGVEKGTSASRRCTADTVVVGITYASLDAARRRAFDENAERIIADLDTRPGFLGYSVRTRLFGNEVWTMSAWCTDADLDAFVASSTHARGIREGMPSVVEPRFVRVTIRRDELPLSWERGLRSLQEGGDRRGY